MKRCIFAVVIFGLLLSLPSCETEDSGSGGGTWQPTTTPGVYTRFYDNNFDIANKTTGFITVFVYFKDYPGDLNLYELVQSGANIAVAWVRPLSEGGVGSWGDYSSYWIYYGQWQIDRQARAIVPVSSQ